MPTNKNSTIRDAQPTMDELAHAVHTAYCRKCGALDFEPFRDEWLAAAKLVQKLGAEPHVFVEAQFSRRVALDPEDLSRAPAVATYCAHIQRMDKKILEIFIYGDRELRSNAARIGDDFDLFAYLMNPFIGNRPVYRYFAALRYGVDQDGISKIVEHFGKRALNELRSSPSLQQYLRDAWHLDPEKMITLLTELIRIPEQIEEDLERGRREAALREPATGGAA